MELALLDTDIVDALVDIIGDEGVLIVDTIDAVDAAETVDNEDLLVIMALVETFDMVDEREDPMMSALERDASCTLMEEERATDR